MKSTLLKIGFSIGIIVVAVVYGPPMFEDELTGDENDKVPDENGEPTNGDEEDDLIEGLEYHFIDVGQADATLIQTDEANKLIDAGHWQRSDTVDYLEDNGIEQIDYLITTHPHADHIGEADTIIENYGVETVFRSGYEHDTNTYERYEEAIEENNVEDITPRAGENYTLETIKLDILSPSEDIYDEAVEENDIHKANLVFTVNYENHTSMFTGDAEEEIEEILIEEDYDLDIYQVGHHGSYTSSTGDFLDAMNPDIAVISCGEDNNYGHPHDVVIDRLESRDIDIRRTDQEGTIIIEL